MRTLQSHRASTAQDATSGVSIPQEFTCFGKGCRSAKSPAQLPKYWVSVFGYGYQAALQVSSNSRPTWSLGSEGQVTKKVKRSKKLQR